MMMMMLLMKEKERERETDRDRSCVLCFVACLVLCCDDDKKMSNSQLNITTQHTTTRHVRVHVRALKIRTLNNARASCVYSQYNSTHLQYRTLCTECSRTYWKILEENKQTEL